MAHGFRAQRAEQKAGEIPRRAAPLDDGQRRSGVTRHSAAEPDAPSVPSSVRVNGMTTETVATAKAFEADPSRRSG